MTLRSQRRLLWTLNVVLAMALVGSVAAMTLLPLDRPATTGSGARKRKVPDAEPPGREEVPLSAYAAVYERDLQRPLYDAAPVAHEPTAAPPKPPVRLIGTVIEPGFTYALLRTKSGEVKWAAVGQMVEGAEVVAVTAESATVRFAGRLHALKTEKKGAGS